MPETNRLDLHEPLRTGSFDHGFVCTYSFDVKFFEEYCLSKLNGISKTASLSVLVDAGTYEKAIQGDEGDRPQQANIRYLLCPVVTPGCFHPKLVLLVGKRRSRLILGSSNFTRPGLTSNAEIGTFLERDAEDPDPLIDGLFSQAFHYLSELSAHLSIEALQSNVEALARDAPWISQDCEIDTGATLIHNLQEPIWGQITASLGHQVTRIDVVSPFFDVDTELLKRTCQDFQSAQVRIFTENGNTTLSPTWLETPQFRNSLLEVYGIQVFDQDRLQPLHGKLLAFRGGERISLFFGSANFTRSALLRTISSGNAEVGVFIRGLEDHGDWDKLLDPNGNGLRLAGPEELRSGRPDHPKHVSEGHRGVQLVEATGVENFVWIRAHVSSEIDWDGLEGDLTFAAGRGVSLGLEEVSESLWKMPISQDIGRRLDEGSTVLRLLAFRGSVKVTESNPMLITNLKEFKTGQNLRKSRHVREAQEGAHQFLRVLNELVEEGEESSLLNFLNFCEIPVLEASGRRSFQPQRPSWTGGTGMRGLGKRNLVIYRKLHAAAMSFFHRHLKKLQIHVERGSLSGVSNYLHIFHGIGGVLRSQVERALIGLEAQDTPFSADDWYDVRQHLDEYFKGFESINACLWDQYLPRIVQAFGSHSVQEEFSGELSALEELRNAMFGYRLQLLQVVQSAIKVRTSLPSIVQAPTTNCLLSEKSWADFRGGIVKSEKKGLALLLS